MEKWTEDQGVGWGVVGQLDGQTLFYRTSAAPVWGLKRGICTLQVLKRGRIKTLAKI